MIGRSRADHGEAAQGHQPTWLLPRAVRERMGTLLRCGRHTVTTKQCRIHRQPLSRHSFAGCDAVTAGRRQGITRQQFLALAHVSWWRNQGARPRRNLRPALDIRLRPSAFRPRTGLLPMGFCCATSLVLAGAIRTREWPLLRVFVDFEGQHVGSGHYGEVCEFF